MIPCLFFGNQQSKEKIIWFSPILFHSDFFPNPILEQKQRISAMIIYFQKAKK